MKTVHNIIFITALFFCLSTGVSSAADENFKIVKPGESFDQFGLNDNGQITYDGVVMVEGKSFYNTPELEQFTEMGVYKPYNGTIFFYALNDIDNADHGFFDINSKTISFKYPCCKWFLADPVGYSQDGRYIFTLDYAETWPVVQIIDLKEKDYLDFNGDFEQYNLSFDENDFLNTKVENFKVDEKNNFSYEVHDMIAGKSYSFTGNVADYKLLQTKPYVFEQYNLAIAPDSANAEMTSFNGNNFEVKYILIGAFLILGLIFIRKYALSKK